MDLLLRLSVLLFMIGSLGGVGLHVSPREAIGPILNARFLFVSFVANWVVCPLVALLVVRIVPLAEPYATGLLLLALAPCAPFAPTMVRLAGGDASYLASFMAFSAVTTVAIMPIGVPLMTGAQADAWAIARPLLLFVLLPMVLGMALKDQLPALADRVRPTIERLTSVVALLMLALIILVYGGGVIDAIGSYAIAAKMLFIAIVTVITHLMGASLDARQRSVITVGTCTRNLGAALAPLSVIERDPRGVVMIAIGALATLALSFVAAKYLSHRASTLQLRNA